MSVRQNAPRLTAADRRIIAKARALCDAQGTDALRAIAPSNPDLDWSLVRVEAFGVAKYLLGELAAIAERLAADTTGEDQ